MAFDVDFERSRIGFPERSRFMLKSANTPPARHAAMAEIIVFAFISAAIIAFFPIFANPYHGRGWGAVQLLPLEMPPNDFCRKLGTAIAVEKPRKICRKWLHPYLTTPVVAARIAELPERYAAEPCV